MKQLFFKSKTPTKLSNLIASWGINPKLVQNVIFFLSKVLLYQKHNDNMSEIYYETIKNTLGDNYTDILHLLEKHNLLIINHSYCPSTELATSKGWNKSYKVTDTAILLLSDDIKDYYFKVRTDKDIKRQIQKHVSKIGYRNQNGTIFDYLKVMNDPQYNDSVMEKVLSSLAPEEETRNRFLLIMIQTKNFNLHHNESDNRVWSPVVQLNENVKRTLMYGDRKIQTIIDIISCHPSFWGLYLEDNNPTVNFGGEIEKYNNIFLNKNINPKQYISNVTGIPTSKEKKKDKVKNILNKYLNGMKIWSCSREDALRKKDWYFIYDEYLRNTFPIMYSTWKNMGNIDRTGVNLSKYYETKLMLNTGIYERAEQLNITISYAYDGMDLYSTDEDKNNCSILLDYIKDLSKKVFGIEIVFKEKQI